MKEHDKIAAEAVDRIQREGILHSAGRPKALARKMLKAWQTVSRTHASDDVVGAAVDVEGCPGQAQPAHASELRDKLRPTHPYIDEAS